MTMQRPFTGMRLDRASTERKDPDHIADLLADPSASSLLAGQDEVVLAAEDEGGELLRATAVPRSVSEAILLGLDADRRPVFAIDLAPLEPDARAEMLDGGQLVSLR